MTRAAQLGLVLVGGAVGGALRIGLTEAMPESSGPVPWDLLLINVVGSLALAWAVARTQAHGPWALFPAIGPGLLGGFTTFSSIACLEWSADAPLDVAAGVLLATMAAAVAAAWLGWWLGDRPPTPLDEAAVFAEENE
ncbi:FluC/FEX family fluoride channel [Demequina mangrovi]|uniref:Fluoride-specific ion channel n=1 Tax=Demequina mangrovi TaxID=1043493 RepID=A0A1H6X593_9MICO|nr:CrcB family protein [Demequina mangrovi]SEJ20130.1 Fluoride ion exporter CrcB/FEX, affects chromosome condensation [Demequina mangrovi]